MGCKPSRWCCSVFFVVGLAALFISMMACGATSPSAATTHRRRRRTRSCRRRATTAAAVAESAATLAFIAAVSGSAHTYTSREARRERHTVDNERTRRRISWSVQFSQSMACEV